MVELDNLKIDRAFYAFSDATRRGIMSQLCRSERRIVDLASEHHSTLTNISKHIKVLESAGLVSVQKIGTSRWCYFNPQGLKSITEVIQFYEKFWTYQLDDLKELAEKIEKKEKKRGSKNN